MQQFVGLDWATRRARWCAVTPAGAVIDEGWIPADENGLGMLVGQGALAVRHWTGVEPDREVMRAAAAAARGG